jgi:hypothetical protein
MDIIKDKEQELANIYICPNANVQAAISEAEKTLTEFKNRLREL